jgi:hypothetical protein
VGASEADVTGAATGTSGTGAITRTDVISIIVGALGTEVNAGAMLAGAPTGTLDEEAITGDTLGGDGDDETGAAGPLMGAKEADGIGPATGTFGNGAITESTGALVDGTTTGDAIGPDGDDETGAAAGLLAGAKVIWPITGAVGTGSSAGTLVTVATPKADVTATFPGASDSGATHGELALGARTVAFEKGATIGALRGDGVTGVTIGPLGTIPSVGAELTWALMGTAVVVSNTGALVTWATTGARGTMAVGALVAATVGDLGSTVATSSESLPGLVVAKANVGRLVGFGVDVVVAPSGATDWSATASTGASMLAIDGEDGSAQPKSLGGAVVVRFVVFKSSSGIS